VRTRSTPGFVLNRVARPFFAEALRLLQEQVVGPATLDAIMRESGGFQMGPLELMDLIGHDVDFAVTTSIFDGFNRAARFRPSVLQKELIDAGRLGRKSGRGIFDYSTGSPAPAPRQIAPQAPPDRIVVHGELGIASSLKTLVGRSGITVEQCDGDGRIEFNGLTLAMTDGRTATERACGEERSEMVLFDLALDYTTSGRIVIAPADQCGEASVRRAAGLFQAIGKSVTRIDDAPGMVVMRTVCMLANEGADAVNEGVCDVKDVDRAMRYGGVCPMGPLVWADRIGLRDVVKTLANMQRSYAEDRYRVSPLLRKKSAAGLDFYA
jgi:3-hydroxybutyryl-CoA dehydrogenase